MPQLTVLMPAFNASPTIKSAVRSTLRSMPRDSELLVMNDGSSDDTAERLAAIPDRRLRVIHHSTPAGVASSLNELLASSDSEFVARMDADDLTLPGRFAGQRRAMAAGRADVLFGGIVRFGEGKLIPLPTSPVRISPKLFPLALLFSNPASHPTMYARRTALEAVGGYRVCAAEDWDLWLRLASADVPMARMGRLLLAYRTHAGQVSGSVEWQTKAVREPVLRQSYDDLALTLTGVSSSSPTFAAALERAVGTTHGLDRAYLRKNLQGAYGRIRTMTSVGSPVG